ncbi:magnesium transporter CorA family protein [Candidatus Peregrinibacteria bacterium]|nr:magnesium transporter CorA family protein [Candidatus Peregrinibacteria bacterium]
MLSVKNNSHQWINIVKPTLKDVAVLKKKFKFHKLDLEDCLQGSQRPKIDEYESYLFIILQFPLYNKRHRRFETEQLNIFIGQNYLITIHDDNLPIIKKIFEKCKRAPKTREQFFGHSTGYLLYELIKALFEATFPITDKIEKSLKRIESDIFEATHPKDQLFNIMLIKKNIISLRKIMLPQRSVVAALEHKQKRFLPEHLVIYFDDIVDKIEKIWGILETQKEVIESLEDTNESLLSHNINSTMKTLTVFSAIMLPLTFLTGLFGMNVKLPFVQAMEKIDHFYMISIIMLTLIVVMFSVFKWKKWL